MGELVGVGAVNELESQKSAREILEGRGEAIPPGHDYPTPVWWKRKLLDDEAKAMFPDMKMHSWGTWDEGARVHQQLEEGTLDGEDERSLPLENRTPIAIPNPETLADIKALLAKDRWGGER